MMVSAFRDLEAVNAGVGRGILLRLNIIEKFQRY